LHWLNTFVGREWQLRSASIFRRRRFSDVFLVNFLAGFFAAIVVVS